MPDGPGDISESSLLKYGEGPNMYLVTGDETVIDKRDVYSKRG